MSNALSFYIILIVAINILGCVALLFFTRKKKQSGEQGKTTGHVYDGIEEYDNPMPRWWLWLFYITIVFAVIYLILYPGLGKFQGVLGWSQIGQYEEEVAEADAKYMPLFEKYAAIPVEALQHEPEALQMGQSIFANTCFGCHGADGRGGIGFPNLTDDDWLYGGTPDNIMYSIMEGRKGAMPAWGAALGEEGVSQVVHYILSENEVERTFKPNLVDEGKTKYEAMCAVCHGKDLSGNVAMGAPNLKDTTWLHGGSISMIKDVIENGIQANMPAHDKILGKEKAHLVTAYVYSLSHTDDEQNQQQ